MPQFFVTDHLQNISDVTDTGATMLARYSFDPEGRRLLVLGTDVTRFGFAHERWHGGSSLWLTVYRSYDPELGRWTSEDPLWGGPSYAAGNLYSFVSNNSIVFVDPLGLYTMQTANVPAPSPDIAALLNCIEGKLNATLIVTATSQGHGPTDPHTHGQAVDVKPLKDVTFDDFKCAAKACGSVYTGDERKRTSAEWTGPHYHMQRTKKGFFR
jgi:RHS repeat-associated protein